MITVALTAGPASEPVSLADAKTHARIEDASSDAYISTLITAARATVETMTGRVFGLQTWETRLDTWADAELDGERWLLHLSPAPVAITSVSVDGVALAPSLYTLRGQTLAVSDDAPDPAAGGLGGAIVVLHTAGQATPAPVVHAIKLLVAHWFENREAVREIGDSGIVMPLGLGALLQPYQVLRVS